MTTNTKAADSYAQRHVACAGLIQELSELIGDIRCPEQGDKVYWSEVNELGRIEEKLAEVRDLLTEFTV